MKTINLVPRSKEPHFCEGVTLPGYFGGYLSKRQKVGQFELKKSIAALHPFKEKLENRNLRSASAQLAHVCNRMFVTLEGKGILRQCTEEFMLASQHKSHDPLAGEFIRTFRHQSFHGKYYLDKFETLMKNPASIDWKTMLPRHGTSKDVFDEVAFYGFRPSHADLFYLSPWEFCQWFKPQRLRRPSPDYDWSIWTASGKSKMIEAGVDKVKAEFIAGEDYVLNEKVLATLPHVFSYSTSRNLSLIHI